MLTNPTPDLIPLIKRIEQAERGVNAALIDAMKMVAGRWDLPRWQRRQLLQFLASLHSPSRVIIGQADSSERIARVA